jgi:hypothetical protein
MSETGVSALRTGATWSSERLGISAQSSSPESEKVSFLDELLSILRTLIATIGYLIGFGTDAKNPSIFADPAAALHNTACFLKMFAWLVPV